MKDNNSKINVFLNKHKRMYYTVLFCVLFSIVFLLSYTVSRIIKIKNEQQVEQVEVGANNYIGKSKDIIAVEGNQIEYDIESNKITENSEEEKEQEDNENNNEVQVNSDNVKVSEVKSTVKQITSNNEKNNIINPSQEQLTIPKQDTKVAEIPVVEEIKQQPIENKVEVNNTPVVEEK